MGLYSIRNLFTKEPVAIAASVRSVIYVLVLLGAIALDAAQLAGIALSLELILGLFARQAVTPVAAPSLPLGTSVEVAGLGENTPPIDAAVLPIDRGA